MKHLDRACDAFRRRIHEVLDGELMDAARRAELDAHLEACDACRAFEAEMRQVQSALQSAPARTLPDEWLEQVFAETSRAPVRRASSGFWSTGWRVAAAAAILAAALWGFWPSGHDTGEYTQAELEQAAAEARLALKLTANALARAERVGIEEVLEDQVSPALKRVPVNLPAAPERAREKS
jgi:anti-sigma factor RsiW